MSTPPLFTSLSSKLRFGRELIARKASGIQELFRGKFGHNPAGEICGGRSDTNCVLDIIKNSGSGLDPQSLKGVTGYTTIKLDGILYKLFKRGRIMINPGGIYTGTRQ